MLQCEQNTIHALKPKARVGPEGTVLLHVVREMAHKMQVDGTVVSACKV